jgi:hypothetical protein
MLVNNPLAMDFTIYRHVNGPKGQVAFGFSLYHRDQQGHKGEMVVTQAAGIGDLNSNVNYELGDLSNGRKYQLSLKVKLAPGENAN